MDSKSVSPKLRFRAEREFGLIVGIIFSLLGGLWLYLGKLGFIAQGKLILGVTLVLTGLVVPRALVLPRRGWMALAEFLFSIISKVALALLYFLVFAPFGFIMRLRGWDPLLRRSASARSYWNDYSERQSDLRHYEKMY
jgi:hypothetical protein